MGIDGLRAGVRSTLCRPWLPGWRCRRGADDRSGIGAVFEGAAAVFNDKVFVSVRNISTRST
jgi:hypothetical protein